MKPKIIIADKIDSKAIKEAREFAHVDEDFEVTAEQLKEKIKNYDAIIIRSRTKLARDIISSGKNLKAIARAGVGLDNVDLDAAKENGITVFNAPESLAISVAEHAIGLMLAVARNVARADRAMRAGRWEKKENVGVELYGKTVGVLGFGRIGREVANRCYAFGMKVITYDPYLTIEDARENNAEKVELEQLFEKSDFVTLHLPATPETKGLVNKKLLSKMKKTAFLINTARGSVVNEKDLIQALHDGAIKGAALDVYENEPLGESPLTKIDHVVLTPHLASGTEDAQRVAGTIVVEKLKEFFKKN